MANKLTATQVKRLAKPGLHGDGLGLYLQITKGGSRSWILRATVQGKRRDIGLGAYPGISLAQARLRAVTMKADIAAGADPLAQRRAARAEEQAAKAAAKVPTFAQAAETVYRLHAPTWRNAKHRTGWMQSLERHTMPALGDMPVSEIRKADVLAVLTPIWTVLPETARRVRQRIRAVMAYAVANDWCEYNPAGDAIDGVLPRTPKVKAHHRALPHAEVAAALETVDASRAMMATRLCLRFLILTAARSGEARGATWAEMDLGAETWSVPGSRMKAGKVHRVPLSNAALAVLADAKALDDGSGLVFPGRYPGRPLSDMSLTKVMRDTGLAVSATVHGFRSSFRDWCAEMGHPRELAESALAHTVGGVEGAYFRSDLLSRRRGLMDAWAAYAAGAPVVALRAVA